VNYLRAYTFLVAPIGLAAKMILSVLRLGWVDAAVGTFDFGVIVVVACFTGISFVLADKTGGIHLADLAVAMVGHQKESASVVQ